MRAITEGEWPAAYIPDSRVRLSLVKQVSPGRTKWAKVTMLRCHEVMKWRSLEVGEIDEVDERGKVWEVREVW
jgi:hypothetical protein